MFIIAIGLIPLQFLMIRTHWKISAAAFLLALAASAQAADQEPALSHAEKAGIARQIATLKSSADRNTANGWSNSKKVAELLCGPAALPILQKQFKGVDRVFLGTDVPSTLTLESDARLSGTGQYRTPQGWQDFTFTCDLNPQTGRVTAFQTAPSPAKS
jgi:hypothetical protein